MRTKIEKISLFCFFLLINVCVQITGIFFTNSSVSTWYPTLEKISWNPPGWVFGPTWTLLYILIAIAGWLIFLCPPSQLRTKALTVYLSQLIVNGLWSYLFFYLQNPFLALFNILMLLVLIGWALYLFWRLSSSPFWIFIPYFLWVFYASILNGAIWILNMK